MTTQEPRRRKRRSSATLERLEELRRARNEQLERERERERRVRDALEPFAEATTAIEHARRQAEERIARVRSAMGAKLAALDDQRYRIQQEHARREDAIRAEAGAEIARWRESIAHAVREIRAAKVPPAEAAALLGLSRKEIIELDQQGKSSTEAASASSGADGEDGVDVATDSGLGTTQTSGDPAEPGSSGVGSPASQQPHGDSMRDGDGQAAGVHTAHEANDEESAGTEQAHGWPDVEPE
ncbi:hypothetical protein [Sciscionella marina]|uniref:hypothetical protein n=1 Tax=Sciscionella marina TaxID=508770 RepID=UPI000374C374|nr:hypothetical protein [Sciscionella marina]